MEEVLTEGIIYHGPGGCPKCAGPLSVIDSEMTLMELNKEGQPISEETSIRCIAMCIHCGHKLEMIRWNGGYIPYDPVSYLFKQVDLENKSKERIQKLNSEAKKNPLAIE